MDVRQAAPMCVQQTERCLACIFSDDISLAAGCSVAFGQVFPAKDHCGTREAEQLVALTFFESAVDDQPFVGVLPGSDLVGKEDPTVLHEQDIAGRRLRGPVFFRDESAVTVGFGRDPHEVPVPDEGFLGIGGFLHGKTGQGGTAGGVQEDQATSGQVQYILQAKCTFHRASFCVLHKTDAKQGLNVESFSRFDSPLRILTVSFFSI